MFQRAIRSSTAFRQCLGLRTRYSVSIYTASATHSTFRISRPGWTWTQKRKSSVSIYIPHKVCSTVLIRTLWNFSIGQKWESFTRTITVSTIDIDEKMKKKKNLNERKDWSVKQGSSLTRRH